MHCRTCGLDIGECDFGHDHVVIAESEDERRRLREMEYNEQPDGSWRWKHDEPTA